MSRHTLPLSPALMGRREAIRRFAVLTGMVVVGSEALLRAEAVPGKAGARDFTDRDRAILDAVADTIIPETETPGARAAAVGPFMATMVADCYDPSEHAAFMAGLDAVDAASRSRFGTGFPEASPEQRTQILEAADAEARKVHAAAPKARPQHYLFLMRDLAILGFFTSEIGCTEVYRYVEVPGSFRPDIPYRKGDPVWI